MKGYAMRSVRKEPILIYQVDAFTRIPFKGNPAAVCILQNRYEDSILQSIASEMNLSETAFPYPLEEKSLEKTRIFSLRWFTPTTEVPLCGHATLATAAVLFYDIGISAEQLTFKTKSGELSAKKDANRICLNFPSNEPSKIDAPKELISAVGVADFKNVAYNERTKSLLIHLFSEDEVRNLKPNYELMKTAKAREEITGIIVTARGKPPYDFVSRFFAPWLGINEDPVTGAAHTVLAPYWSKILQKKEMFAFQASQRGGELTVRLRSNERVDLVGNTVIVLKGELYLTS
jgi:PhzF family phenazine biosynthesis protein